MTSQSEIKDVVGISSLNVDYIYETADLSFLQPFYPEGQRRRAWLLTDSEEIQKLKTILPEKAHGAETWDLPAEVIRAKDTTGAGDVFAAGFLVEDYERALQKLGGSKAGTLSRALRR